jgi:histidinol-phosphate/aromatic aminotransferase/cobyric acid decarboxylase-like protein
VISSRHGGNRQEVAERLGCRPGDLLDASASLVPFALPWALRWRLAWNTQALRHYPDRRQSGLRAVIAALHGVEPEMVLPGNGAAELFTWAARDAAAAGISKLPAPGFADYGRALATWGGGSRPLPLPLHWDQAFPQPFPAVGGDGGVLWITNPHNPTGQLWSRASLEPLLARHALVIADEAFLPLTPGGEAQSLVPLVAQHPNLVVVRSLTKLYAIAGLRLGYAIAAPERLARWAAWRDPWPVNGLAAALGEALFADPRSVARWQARVQAWVAAEGPWLAQGLARLPGLEVRPSATNFLLLRGVDADGGPRSLVPLREALERHQRLLLRDCRSFAGLGEAWLRVALQDRSGNRRLLRALTLETSRFG